VSDDLIWMDATAQAELVQRREVSARDLVDEAIGRIERLNPDLNAVIHERFERARVEAASYSGPDGPFAGVPFLVKDLVAHSAGDPFHEGIKTLADRGFIEDADTELVRRFHSVGFITVGRTNTSELGLLPLTEPASYGATRNPWDRERSTLGSGGGSAAAVAAGIVPVAHSNDGGGSIRLPASACGLVGLKPSRGRVTLGPDFGDLASGCLAEFVITRSIRDAACLLDVVANPPSIGEPYVAPSPDGSFIDACRSAGSLRIGVMTSSPGGRTDVHPDCVTAVDITARLLGDLGHHVEESHPSAIDEADFGRFAAVLMPCAFAAFALDWWERRTGIRLGPDDVEAWTWMCAERGRRIDAGRYLSSVEWIQAWTRRMASWWAESFDLLLTPTAPVLPPLLGTVVDPEDPAATGRRSAELIPFTYPFNMTGQPAISLPLHWNGDGHPIGVQLVAAPGREDHLFRAAWQLEQFQPWFHRHPAINIEAS
jgi:amidase